VVWPLSPRCTRCDLTLKLPLASRSPRTRRTAAEARRLHRAYPCSYPHSSLGIPYHRPCSGAYSARPRTLSRESPDLLAPCAARPGLQEPSKSLLSEYYLGRRTTRAAPANKRRHRTLGRSSISYSRRPEIGASSNTAR
jgi:hypothetical protein